MSGYSAVACFSSQRSSRQVSTWGGAGAFAASRAGRGAGAGGVGSSIAMSCAGGIGGGVPMARRCTGACGGVAPAWVTADEV